jgi:hypothetical protein
VLLPTDRQNRNFKAKCTTRGSPADVIVPNAAEPTTAFGAMKWALLLRRRSRREIPVLARRRAEGVA